MNQTELLNRLLLKIPADEWRRLVEGDASLAISRHNRETLLRMRRYEPSNEPVSDADVRAMERLLNDYLERYMPDRPEGHRYIVSCCLFLAFVTREPLHPAEIVNHRQTVENGVIRYRCPAREDVPGSLCRFCVCEGMSRASVDDGLRS